MGVPIKKIFVRFFGKVGCVCFDVITTQMKDNGHARELTSGEINFSAGIFLENRGRKEWLANKACRVNFLPG